VRACRDIGIETVALYDAFFTPRAIPGHILKVCSHSPSGVVPLDNRAARAGYHSERPFTLN
jgi:hypothetical protein